MRVTDRRRWLRSNARRATAVIAVALVGALAGCGDDDEGAAPAAEGSALAVARVGGTVETIDSEDEYGARGKVDVIAPDGEYSVHVSATGEVVRVDGPFQD